MAQPWDPFEPRSSEWTLKLAGHLLRRATFGFTPDRLQQAFTDGPQKTIDRLLAPPPGYDAFEQTIASLTSREATPLQTAQLSIYRMLHSPYPYREKSAFIGSQPDAIRAWLLAGVDLTPPPGADATAILRSNAFFSAANYRRKVKSPLEYALNLAIPFDVALPPAQLYSQLTTLGQRFPEPATSRRWLNSFTIIGRSNLASGILARVPHFPDRATLIDTFLQNDAPADVLAKLSTLDGRDLAQAIANLPEFQLL
jgi:hypothetical protein